MVVRYCPPPERQFLQFFDNASLELSSFDDLRPRGQSTRAPFLEAKLSLPNFFDSKMSLKFSVRKRLYILAHYSIKYRGF